MKRAVEEGSDRIAQRYHDDRGRFDERRQLEAFSALLPAGARILDAGCGAGVPVARYLVDRGFAVQGIDLSSSMLALARQHVPEATFTRMDMSVLDFPAASFDGLVASCSMFHVHRARHSDLLRGFHVVLKPDAPVLVNVPLGAWEGTEAFHGAEMFWSHYDSATSQALIEGAGFRVANAEQFRSGDEDYVWILART